MNLSFACSGIIDQNNSIDLCHLYKHHDHPRSLTAESVMSKTASLALQPLSFACRRMSHNVLWNMDCRDQRYNAPLISSACNEIRTSTMHVNEFSGIWLEKTFKVLLNFNPTWPWWKTPKKARSIYLKGLGRPASKRNNACLCMWRYRKSLMCMDFLLKVLRVSGGLGSWVWIWRRKRW